MSNQQTTTTTTTTTAEPGTSSLSEYAAAEERLLDFFSPTNATALDNNVSEVDPSRDNIVPLISDDSDIRSLLSRSEDGFKGFNVENDEGENNEHSAGGDQALIFGIHLSADNRLSCRTAKSQLTAAPVELLEDSSSMGYILTNGNEPHDEQEEDPNEAECVIYEENVMLLADDQCCEIIVHTDQDIERTYLLGIQAQQQQQHQQQQEQQHHLQLQQQQQLNGASYNCELLHADEEEEHELHASHVYLSDAALVPQQHHLQQQQEQQQLLLDASIEEEEVQQISDSYVDDRPDICEVYDHELEEHDVDQQHVDEDEEQEQDLAAAIPVAAVPRSSTTEFPVSSTSMPNGSDNDDYDDELGTAATEERSPPQRRKYVGLLKNTLSADAMDRRLANICQSQPQMSVNEKLANWNCDHNCDVVEDVENFEAEFEQHEAEPDIQPKYNEFYDILRQGLTKLTHEFQQQNSQSEDSTVVPKRPNYRRLLQHATPVDAPIEVDIEPEPIVLDDDDDDDDDCVEVQITSSDKTLIAEPIAINQETQTKFELSQSKETSTTDLINNSPNPTAEHDQEMQQPQVETVVIEEQNMEMEEQHCQVFEHQMEQMEQDDVPEEIVRSDSMEDMHRHVQLYQQQEFCNYLGLTELATANAVATAMRELANSNVARRSLRVRTQQQLDRMRSDVRGKRRQRKREREQQQQQQQQDKQPDYVDQQQQQPEEEQESNQLTSSSSRSGRNSSSSRSSTNSRSVTSHSNEHQQNHSLHNHNFQHAQQKMEFVYCPQRTQPNLPLETAFANVYAAAAPAHVYESIQDRLRQARESKPSIYIVQTVTNNGLPKLPTRESPVVEEMAPQSTRKTPEKKSKFPVQVVVKKTTPRKLPKKNAKRRRTTGAGTSASTSAAALPERELITRSMNSKMLRNRKVNMLKTCELSDGTAQGRNRQRLAGGTNTTISGKRLKGGKKTAKKPEDEPELNHEKELQMQKYKKEFEQTNREQQEILAASVDMVRTERGGRAKSLPANFDNTSDMTLALVDGQTDSQTSRQLGGIVTRAIGPPPYSAAVRHCVNLVRKSRERPPAESRERPPAESRDLPPAESRDQHQFNAFHMQFEPLTSPTASTHGMIHFSRRPHLSSSAQERLRIQSSIQMTPPGGLVALKTSPAQLRNPLSGKYGKVLHVYYELDQLIAVQERFISFWKCSKIYDLLQNKSTTTNDVAAIAATTTTAAASTVGDTFGKNTTTTKTARTNFGESDKFESVEQRWVFLGGLRRNVNDIEISAPFENRLCGHNSTPVYIEMRSRSLDHHRRETKLLSLYVNVYYYCEEAMRPKVHSVHLDAVNCEPRQVIYTCIAESRYFVMAWQQDTTMGKPRAGICKYSLTPPLDTLASIREFKQLRHELLHIEVLTDDRLIGYGKTRITIWDHRSGDTLMNYDFGFTLGLNLGVMHLPNYELDQHSMLVLYQHNMDEDGGEVRIIACELTHTNPTHRVLHVHRLPSPQFDGPVVAVNTGDHLILRSQTDHEIWIGTSDLRELTYMAPQQTQRFYSREKSQIITLTADTLIVDSITNHILKMAVKQQQNLMIQAAASRQFPFSI